MICFKRKIKGTGNRLKWWNKEVFGWLDLKVDEEVKDLHDMDVLVGNYEEDMMLEVVEKRKVRTTFGKNCNTKSRLK